VYYTTNHTSYVVDSYTYFLPKIHRLEDYQACGNICEKQYAHQVVYKVSGPSELPEGKEIHIQYHTRPDHSESDYIQLHRVARNPFKYESRMGSFRYIPPGVSGQLTFPAIEPWTYRALYISHAQGKRIVAASGLITVTATTTSNSMNETFNGITWGPTTTSPEQANLIKKEEGEAATCEILDDDAPDISSGVHLIES